MILLFRIKLWQNSCKPQTCCVRAHLFASTPMLVSVQEIYAVTLAITNTIIKASDIVIYSGLILLIVSCELRTSFILLSPQGSK